MNTRPYISLLFPALVFVQLNAFAQTSRDTVMNGHKIGYNSYELYSNPTDLDNKHPLLCIGHVKNDSVRTGTWYFFYPSGKLLAKGKYVDGYKKGIWTYYPRKNESCKVKWTKAHQLKTEIIFDHNNDPVIKDVTGRGLELFNGRERNRYLRQYANTK